MEEVLTFGFRYLWLHISPLVVSPLRQGVDASLYCSSSRSCNKSLRPAARDLDKKQNRHVKDPAEVSTAVDLIFVLTVLWMQTGNQVRKRIPSESLARK